MQHYHIHPYLHKWKQQVKTDAASFLWAKIKADNPPRKTKVKKKKANVHPSVKETSSLSSEPKSSEEFITRLFFRRRHQVGVSSSAVGSMRLAQSESTKTLGGGRGGGAALRLKLKTKLFVQPSSQDGLQLGFKSSN